MAKEEKIILFGDAKEKINCYYDHATNQHLDVGNKYIMGHIFTRAELRKIASHSDNNHIFVMLGLNKDSDDEHIRLILAGVNDGRGEINTNHMIISDPDPYNGDIILADNSRVNSRVFDRTLDINQKEYGMSVKKIPGEDISSFELHEALMTYLHGADKPDILCIKKFRNNPCVKVTGYNIENEDLIAIGLFEEGENIEDSDQFMFIPVVIEIRVGNKVVKRPYLSFALVGLNDGTLVGLGREYFNPCPDNCGNYKDLFIK